MKSLTIQLSDFEFDQLGLNKVNLSFSELLEIVNTNVTKQMLEKSIRLADKYGFSGLTMDEINSEIRAYRDEKDNS